MTASSFLQNLAQAVAVEQTPPRDVSDLADLIGVWHWVGGACITLPAETEGFGVGEVTKYAREFRISPARLRNSFDRHGHSSLIEILSSEENQLQMFGEIVCRRGPWPQNVLPVRPGSHEAVELAQAERARIWAIADPDRRGAELTAARKRWGNDWFGEASRSHTLADDLGGSGREALSRPS